MDDSTTSDPPSSESSFLEEYLNYYFQKDSSNLEVPELRSENDKIYQLIKELEFRQKVSITVPASFKLPSMCSGPSTSSAPLPTIRNNSQSDRFDVLKYWANEKIRRPEMYRLAMVVLSAPSTQITVERAFSALKLVLTDHRRRLGDKRIQNIMVLKLNPDLIPQISRDLSTSFNC